MENIALVVLDTLRKNAFDRHFDWLPGLRFENAWAPSHWTVPVHASMFTGQYPSELGVYATAERLDCPDTVLAEHLSRTGYTTRAFSTNGNISSYFDYDRGFDVFDVNWRAEGWQEELELNDAGDVFDWKRFDSESTLPPVIHSVVGMYRSFVGDYDIGPSIRHWLGRKLRGPGSPGFEDTYRDFGASEALEWIRTQEFSANGEFCFINLMEAHNPYEPPEDYQTVDPVRIHGLTASVFDPEADPERVRTAYDDSVRYLSDVYERIFEELQADFDYIVTLSDHGELLGEHDRWEHLCGLYPELTHVPLVITGVAPGTREEMVNLRDVHRTISSLAGIDPVDTADGRNVLDPQSSPEPTLAEYHGLSPLHVRSLSEEELAALSYLDTDLRAVAVPPKYYGYETAEGEWQSRGSSPVEDPRQLLSELQESLNIRHVTDEEYEAIEDEVLDHLEDLGYA
jgi:arylsulfatase A-like enzyme